MRSLVTALAVVLVAGLTLFSGYLQGRLRNRWGTPADLVAAAQLLEATPTEFGNWKLTKQAPLSDNVARMLECAGYVSGSYVDQTTGEVVSAVVLLGPPGPISVHTPEICYSSHDYTQTGERERQEVPNAASSATAFWTLTFHANNLNGDRLRVYYGWSDGSQWTAAPRPRTTYAGQPLLYKLQLAANLADDAKPGTDDSGIRFLRDFVPVLQRQLVHPTNP